jgi:hypothetical protein
MPSAGRARASVGHDASCGKDVAATSQLIEPTGVFGEFLVEA